MTRKHLPIAAMLCASMILIGVIWSVSLLGATSRPQVAAARAKPAPAYVTRGKQLVNHFFEMLRPGDHHAALQAFLAPWFQRQGETTYAQKGAYIAHPPVVTKWSLARFHITHGPQTIVVDFWVKASEIVNGVQLNAAAYSPRLAVFQCVGGRWQLSAYTSFNPPV